MNFARFKPGLNSGLLTSSFLALLLLLGVAAVLMHRALNRASEADVRQDREVLEAALRNATSEFTMLMRDLPDFGGNPRDRIGKKLEPWISEQISQWRRKTTRPQFIQTISIGTVTREGVTTFYRVTPANEADAKSQTAFVKTEWPAALEMFRADLQSRAQNKDFRPMGPDSAVHSLIEARPLIVVPLVMSVAMPRQPVPEFRPRRPQEFFLPDGRPGFGRPPFGGPPGYRRMPPDFRPTPFDPQRRPPEQRPSDPQAQRPDESLPQNPAFPEFNYRGRRLPPRVNQPMRSRQQQPPRLPAMPPVEQLVGFGFLELNAEYLQQQFLPELLKRQFSIAGLTNYHIAVIQQPAQRMLSSQPANVQLSAATFTQTDAASKLFEAGVQRWRGLLPDLPPGSLQLLARHQQGSIETVAARLRRRNLLLGYGILSLLLLSGSSLIYAAQRARTLAKRQMEFVAGVTHELRTPLTVIQSAGFNLASGRVGEAERVKQYGSMIQTEGRRLGDMIEQILSYAGIEAGKKKYDLQPVSVTELIERSLSEYQSSFDEAGWKVEKTFEAELPLIHGDRIALESAIKNLLHNALKYATSGKWLGISATHDHNEVQIMIADHGAGIAPEDLPHIFEPFYRGQQVVASTTSGAGLGLSLVERHLKAHRGRVTVHSTEQGTAFTLHLPAMA